MAEHALNKAAELPAELTAEQLITENLDIWTSAIEQKSASGRGSSKKFSLHGIKKLRELILELAVRGKLVPQASREARNSEEYEPASVLLERIAAEKAQLVKDKKIKKPKSLPEISENEKPFERPKGWEWVCLSSIGVFSGGKTPSKANSSYWNGSIPWVTPKDMKVDRIYDSEDHVTQLAIDDGLVEVPKESLLFVARSGILRRKFPTAITKTKCTVNQDLKILTLFDSSMANYVLLMMKGFESYILKNLTKMGTTVESLRFDDFSKHYFLLPPLEEQQRIVAKVDELMSLCDALEAQTEASISAHQTLVEVLLNGLIADDSGKTAMDGGNVTDTKKLDAGATFDRVAEHFDTLFTTSASIDTLKQTILQLAVMGKLVEQASCEARNSANYEPAAKLLERIAAEKAQLIADKKIKKQKPLPAITDEEKPFELPQGGEWVRFGDLCNLVTSGSRGWKAYYSDEGATFIRSQDIKYDRVEFDERAYVKLPETTEGKRTKVDVGNLLMTITGANVGKAAIVETVLDEAYVSQHVALIKLINNSMNKYLHIWLTGEFGGREQLLECSYGAKPGLNLQNINELLIPLAPLEEQHRIVAKVDELMALCDQLKARLSDAQTTKLHLTDAIVEQATN